jgi:hypothetical protein
MCADRERAKQIIRNLLNVAEDDAAAEGEINNALAFARQLMLRHQIDEGDVAKPKDEPQRSVHERAADCQYAKERADILSSKKVYWQFMLAKQLCRLIGTIRHYHDPSVRTVKVDGRVQFNKNGSARRAIGVVFYGPAEDVQDAVSLFQEWTEVIMAMARLRYTGVTRGAGRDYCEGFCRGIEAKLDDMLDAEDRKLNHTNGCKDLILADARALMVAKREQAKHYLSNECGIRLRTGAARSNYRSWDGNAFQNGKSDGKRANISRQRKPKIEGS